MSRSKYAAVQIALSFDADHRLESGDRRGKPGFIRGVDNFGDTLIRSRRFFRHTAHRAAANEYATSSEAVDDFLASPLPQRLMSAHASPGAVASRTEG